MDGAPALRVAFLGNDEWSVPALEALVASRHEVVFVGTAEPKPAGRGNVLTPTPVAGATRRLGLPLHEVETIRTGHGFKELSTTAPDVLTVVAYGELLPPNVLHAPRVSAVNLHFSLLPKLRGASPVQTALLIGAERTGVTTIVMDRGLDTGPILLQREETIRPEDDAGSLGARLAELGAAVLVETLDLMATEPLAPRPQDESLATLAPRFGPEDRVLDWTNPARVLVNLVRALSPEPAATTRFRGEGLKVFRAEAVDMSGEVGRIAQVDRDGFVIATREGGFRPLEVAPAGRKRMSAAEYVHGYRPDVAERVG
jgi:methionyl-tRNA formyltransferase